jgi:hypothetical protein
MIPENKLLADLHGNPIRESIETTLIAEDAAFDWHRKNVLIQ